MLLAFIATATLARRITTFNFTHGYCFARGGGGLQLQIKLNSTQTYFALSVRATVPPTTTAIESSSSSSSSQLQTVFWLGFIIIRNAHLTMSHPLSLRGELRRRAVLSLSSKKELRRNSWLTRYCVFHIFTMHSFPL